MKISAFLATITIPCMFAVVDAFSTNGLSPRNILQDKSSNTGNSSSRRRRIPAIQQLFAGTDSNSNQDITTAAKNSFAYQELRANLQAMIKRNIASRDLPPAKRMEITNYVEKVIATTRQEASSQKVYLDQLATIGEQLPNTKWRLAFSTQAATLGDLPQDATIYLDILEGNQLDYILKFSKKTFGLESITARCQYLFDAGPTNPGLLTFIYDKITTNMFGLSNLAVGFFGLLQGRANYVESVYFDGAHWIEYGVDPTGEVGYYNVYVRVEDDDNWNQ